MPPAVPSRSPEHLREMLREGAKFHDGTPVNAEAVKYSFERTIEKGLGVSYVWAPVDHFEVTDEYTLVAHLSHAASMDLVVRFPCAAYVMSPTTMKEKGNDWIAAGNEAGSGPYYIESNTAGKQGRPGKFDDYWGGWKENQFDRVVIQSVSEASSRRLMLESGGADVVSATDHDQSIELYRQAQRIIYDDMIKFILKCILAGMVVLIGVIVVTFAVTRLVPSKPELQWVGTRATAEQLEAARIELGLDKSVPEQFII